MLLSKPGRYDYGYAVEESKMHTERIALYPGSFNPVTSGHVDVVERASRLFDKVIIGVGTNTAKKAMFTVEERLEHLRLTCGHIAGVEVASFPGLLTEAVHDFNAIAVIRGLRAVSDFEWEFQMALMNRELSPSCETVFLMPRVQYSYVSSTMIREIARLHGDVSAFVPAPICQILKERFST